MVINISNNNKQLENDLLTKKNEISKLNEEINMINLYLFFSLFHIDLVFSIQKKF